MKKLKYFIDNLAPDKKSHVVLGEIINPPIMIAVLIALHFLHKITIDFSIYLDVLISVLSCLLVHIGIEIWQRKTGNGKAEFWDAAAGTYSAITKGIIAVVVIFLVQNISY